MIIDGAERRIEDQDVHKARGELYLTPDFHLVEATRWLMVDTGNGQTRVSLPYPLYVVVFESMDGRREYGVAALPS